MKNLLVGLLIVFAGCGTMHAQYVQADEETYIYASPKLKEWAEMKNDPEWVEIVSDKDVAWKARIDRAKAKLAEEE